jgi:DNA-binding NarL/FixJ family response regulator
VAEVTRVLIADEHAVVRAGLAKILEAEPNIRIVGEARNGSEAIDKSIELNPDIILMDVFMPGCNGLESMVAIKERIPEVKIIIMTVSESKEELCEVLKLGAIGYLVKSASEDELLGAVKRAFAGEIILPLNLVTALIDEIREEPTLLRLSAREKQVLDLLEECLSDAEIARRLFISERTVRTYLRRLLDKLHLKNRVEAAVYAARRHTT